MRTLSSKGLLLTGLVFGMFSVQAFAEKKLKTTNYEIIVDVTPQEAWEVINSWGNIGTYHSSISSSKSLNGSEINASVGCERQCTVQNGKKEILISEKVIEYSKGEFLKYKVTEAVGFPIDILYNTIGVKVNKSGKTVIYIKTEFRLKPAFLTGMVKGKMQKSNRADMIAYKHYMETGEKNVDSKILEEKYKDL